MRCGLSKTAKTATLFCLEAFADRPSTFTGVPEMLLLLDPTLIVLCAWAVYIYTASIASFVI
jgi:hypothetical protein